MTREIRFGSRESALAVVQTRLVMDAVAAAHPELKLTLITMKTRGDLHPEIPFGGENVKGLFTGALELALANDEIDLCVHSLKDLSVIDNENLPIVGMPRRDDPRDVLLLPRIFTDRGEEKLRINLPIGCGSQRRITQLRDIAPAVISRFFVRDYQFATAPIRGNVPTRIAKLDAQNYGAIILAAAGLNRLKLAARADYYFSIEEMTPAAGQGILAIQGRRNEDYKFLESLRDPTTEIAAAAERKIVRELGGDCDTPVGAYAQIDGTEVKITAMRESAGKIFRETITGSRPDIFPLAEKLIRRLQKKIKNYELVAEQNR